MKKVEILTLLSFILSIFFSNILIFSNKYDRLKDNVIRVHILANSNSKKDQNLKLKIKDDVSAEIFKLLKNAKNKSQAQKIILDNLAFISELSKNKLEENGCHHNVNVSLTKSYFPTKEYDKFTFPAGFYDAVKVVIGNGQGYNWWCVAFPPMCSPIYDNQKNNSEILGAEQLELIQNPCELKFAFWELILNLSQKFHK